MTTACTPGCCATISRCSRHRPVVCEPSRRATQGMLTLLVQRAVWKHSIFMTALCQDRHRAACRPPTKHAATNSNSHLFCGLLHTRLLPVRYHTPAADHTCPHTNQYPLRWRHKQ
jgi:hypothetical protein